MKTSTLLKIEKSQIEKIKLMNQHEIIHYLNFEGNNKKSKIKKCVHCNKTQKFPTIVKQRDIIIFFNHHKTCKRYIFDVLLKLKFLRK